MPKPAKLSPSEHQIQSGYFRWVNKKMLLEPRYGLIYAIPNGGLRSGSTGAMMKREGARRGVFDIHVMIPRKGYHGLMIETKKKGGKLSPEQRQYLSLYQEHGYATAVCYNLKELIEVTECYLSNN